MSVRRILPILLLSAISVAACHRSRGNRVPTANEASGRAACPNGPEQAAQPLIVDLQPERRADLEVAMRRGAAVVRWDCEHLVVMPRCAIAGGYSYEGTSPKEQLIRMVDGNAVRATLPVTGGQLAADLSGAFHQGTSLDLALVMVGKRTSSLTASTTDDLRGSCEGATHVVQSATLGAFAMSTGVRSTSRTVAEVFGAGVAATSTRSQHVQTKDGDVSACSTSMHGAAEPPARCDAVLRVELLPIEAPFPPITVLDPEQVESLRGRVCPEVETCRAECDAGNARGCHDWGTVLALGDRVPRDLGLSTKAFRRSCELGEMNACTMIGIALLTRGPRADLGRGRGYLERACERGTAVACETLGISHDNAGDSGEARRYFERACALGESAACTR